MYTDLANPLLNRSVDEFFDGQKRDYNYSFLPTLRYIAIKHCDGDLSRLKGSFKLMTRGWSSETYVEEMIDNIKELPAGAFCLYQPVTSNRLSLPNQIEVDGWTRLNVAPYPVEQYLSKTAETIVLVNESNKSVAIIIGRNATRIEDAIESIMFRIWTWYYPSKTISKDEVALFKAVSDSDEDKYITLCQELFEKYDFDWNYNKIKLNGWDNKFVDAQILSAEREMDKCMRDIGALNLSVEGTYRRYSIAQTTYKSLIGTRQESNDTVASFFGERKNYIHIYSIEDTCCTFNIVETIDFYDDEAFLALYNNRKSTLFAGGEKIAKAMKGIFIDGIGKFRVESTFNLVGLITLTPEQYGEPYRTNTALHPHLCRFGCLGGNERYIHEYLQEGQWEQAIDQAVAATKNINFADATVIKYFVQYLDRQKTKKFIVRDDGSFISINDVIEIMNMEETSNG